MRNPSGSPSCGGSTTSLLDLRTRRNLSVTGDVSEVVVRGRFVAYADGRVVLGDGAKETVLKPGPGIEDGSLAFLEHAAVLDPRRAAADGAASVADGGEIQPVRRRGRARLSARAPAQ